MYRSDASLPGSRSPLRLRLSSFQEYIHPRTHGDLVVMLELEMAQSFLTKAWRFTCLVLNLDTPCQIPSMSSNGTSKAGVSLSIWLLMSQMHKDLQRQECTPSFMNSQGSTCPCSKMRGAGGVHLYEFNLLKQSCESAHSWCCTLR